MSCSCDITYSVQRDLVVPSFIINMRIKNEKKYSNKATPIGFYFIGIPKNL